ncbi:MAG: alpha-galactosidase [Sphingobacteriales bacterium]|nr:MAG: alpha-galactosidase [Sphingobacteriales bacterium]
MQDLTLDIQYRLGKKTKRATLHVDIQQQIIEGLTAQISTQELMLGKWVKIELQIWQDLVLDKLAINLPYTFQNNERLFCNGFQSWTLSEEYPVNHRFKKVRFFAKNLISAFGDYQIYPYTEKTGILHSWTYAFIRSKDRLPIFFIGSTDERSAYTLIEFDSNKPNGKITISKDCESLQVNKGRIFNAFSLYIACGSENEVFDSFFELMKTNLPEKAAHSSFPGSGKTNPAGGAGFTSWYHYYTKINEKVILDNLEAFKKHQVPINFFQIDDGWQQAVGDWMQVNQKFPNGLKLISESIHKQGYQSGLWLAPFICQSQSELYQKHSEFLLRQKNGNPVKAAYNFLWRSFMYPLNFYNPRVQDYLKKVFDTILNQWGFDMVKLDFLYAVALQPPPGKTRGQVMYEAMDWLRKTVGDKLILGCGVPLSAAMGQTDFCRIGPDIHLKWDFPLLNWLGSREGVSTINAIKNTINRHQLNGRAFFNDPDVSILRLHNHNLLPEQQYTLFIINQLFGSLQFVSDNINEYTPDMLHLYLSQFPLQQKNIYRVAQENEVYRIGFSIGELHYLLFSNLTAKSINLQMSDEIRFLPENFRKCFYHNRLSKHIEPEEIISILPFQTICLLAVNTNNDVSLAGGNSHLFPCSDIVLNGLSNGSFIAESQTLNRKFNFWVYSKSGKPEIANGKLLLEMPYKEGFLYHYESK